MRRGHCSSIKRGAWGMTTIQVITGENKAEFADVLDEYFRLRHEVFVGERGWNDLRRPDGRDIDAYDNDNAS
jgi:acyl-homoserine lactone synthase